MQGNIYFTNSTVHEGRMRLQYQKKTLIDEHEKLANCPCTFHPYDLFMYKSNVLYIHIAHS